MYMPWQISLPKTTSFTDHWKAVDFDYVWHDDPSPTPVSSPAPYPTAPKSRYARI